MQPSFSRSSESIDHRKGSLASSVRQYTRVSLCLLMNSERVHGTRSLFSIGYHNTKDEFFKAISNLFRMVLTNGFPQLRISSCRRGSTIQLSTRSSCVLSLSPSGQQTSISMFGGGATPARLKRTLGLIP